MYIQILCYINVFLSTLLVIYTRIHTLLRKNYPKPFGKLLSELFTKILELELQYIFLSFSNKSNRREYIEKILLY